MNEQDTERNLRWCSWALHLYTASGAVIGVLALKATAAGDALLAFQLMFLTIFIDGTDGMLARKLEVWKRLPQIDGRRLDDVVDYFTYVAVPIIAMVQLGMLTDHVLIWAPPIMASAFGFANVAAKTDDDYFLGFPSYWNLVGLYVFFLHWPVWANNVLVLILSGLVFAPIRFVYPSKTKPFRTMTILFGIVWTLQTLALVVCPGKLPDWWLATSLLYPVYYLALSLYLNKRPDG
jgi:phosphatidylcholine synthase